MVMLTDLADVARSAGLQVVETDGWRSRGHGPMAGVQAIVVHHTAGPATGDAPSLRVVRDGRPDLAGPLSHLLLARSGGVHVVAAGLCWHSGATLAPWQANRFAIGIEAEHTGRPGDPWPPDQYAALVRLARRLADHYRVPYARILGHKEVCSPKGRKVDPTFPMDPFRAAVATPDAARTDWTSLPVLEHGMRNNPDVAKLQEWLTRMYGYCDFPATGNYLDQTAACLAEFQRRTGVRNPDGSLPDGRRVGDRTRRALWDEGYRG